GPDRSEMDRPTRRGAGHAGPVDRRVRGPRGDSGNRAAGARVAGRGDAPDGERRRGPRGARSRPRLMVWQRGATDSEPEEEPPTPWRAGAVETPEEQRRRVALEAWDTELTPAEIEQRPTIDQVELRRRRRELMGRAGFIVLAVLAGLGAAAGVAVAWMHVVGDPLADAHAYYEAASRLNAGQPLYPAGIDPSSNHIYLYPPLLAVILRPLALLPYGLFALLWELIVCTAFVMLLRHLGVRKRSTWIALGLLGIPIGWALSVAQAHVPMTLLMAIGQPWSIA